MSKDAGDGRNGLKEKKNQAVSGFGHVDGRRNAGDADALSGQGGLERQQAQLVEAAQAYGEAQSANNRLKGQLAEIGTKEFVERTARRDYGYCWYGEIIYQVGNLDEIEQQLEFDVYGQD